MNRLLKMVFPLITLVSFAACANGSNSGGTAPVTSAQLKGHWTVTKLKDQNVDTSADSDGLLNMSPSGTPYKVRLLVEITDNTLKTVILGSDGVSREETLSYTVSGNTAISTDSNGKQSSAVITGAGNTFQIQNSNGTSMIISRISDDQFNAYKANLTVRTMQPETLNFSIQGTYDGGAVKADSGSQVSQQGYVACSIGNDGSFHMSWGNNYSNSTEWAHMDYNAFPTKKDDTVNEPTKIKLKTPSSYGSSYLFGSKNLIDGETVLMDSSDKTTCTLEYTYKDRFLSGKFTCDKLAGQVHSKNATASAIGTFGCNIN